MYSTRVYQLESAMGSAIECFADAGAVVVGRDRFVPVKTCSDLLVLRSDLYEVASDGKVVATTTSSDKIPTVTLDDRFYKKVDDFERLVVGVPSLKKVLTFYLFCFVFFCSDGRIESVWG